MLSAVIIAITVANITIEYRFANTTANDVYVFDTLFRIAVDGTHTPDPELVYVIPGELGEGVVGKYLAAIPPGMKVEAPEVPYLQLVSPGRTVMGRATIPIPISRYAAYSDPDQPDPGESGQVKRLRLRIGVLNSATFPATAPVVEKAFPPPPDRFICDYGFGLALQRFFEVELMLPEPISEHFRR